jgi:hypothetical protein
MRLVSFRLFWIWRHSVEELLGSQKNKTSCTICKALWCTRENMDRVIIMPMFDRMCNDNVIEQVDLKHVLCDSYGGQQRPCELQHAYVRRRRKMIRRHPRWTVDQRLRRRHFDFGRDGRDDALVHAVHTMAIRLCPMGMAGPPAVRMSCNMCATDCCTDLVWRHG